MSVATEHSNDIARAVSGQMKHCPYGACFYAEDWQKCSQFVFVVSDDLTAKTINKHQFTLRWNRAMSMWSELQFQHDAEFTLNHKSVLAKQCGQQSAPRAAAWEKQSISMHDGKVFTIMNASSFAVYVMQQQEVTTDFLKNVL